MRLGTQMAASQRGGVLLVALVFLVVLGLFGLTSMQSSRLQLRMANNEEVRINAHQAAQALVDAVAGTPDMTPVIGAAGYTLCTPGQPDCDNESLFMPDGDLADEVDDGHLWGTAVMTAPTNSPPPRGLGFSADKFTSTAFQVETTYDRADDGLGRADVTAGLIILTPIN
jgi:hypothetical protein